MGHFNFNKTSKYYWYLIDNSIVFRMLLDRENANQSVRYFINIQSKHKIFLFSKIHWQKQIIKKIKVLKNKMFENIH